MPNQMQSNPYRTRGKPSQTDLTINRTGTELGRSDSNGLIELCDGDTRRVQGTALIARQLELENMKARQFKIKEKISEKNLSLRQDAKMNSYLEKIHKEHFAVE